MTNEQQLSKETLKLGPVPITKLRSRCAFRFAQHDHARGMAIALHGPPKHSGHAQTFDLSTTPLTNGERRSDAALCVHATGNEAPRRLTTVRFGRECGGKGTNVWYC